MRLFVTILITTVFFVLQIQSLHWFGQGDKNTCSFMAANNCLQHEYFTNAECEQEYILCSSCIEGKKKTAASAASASSAASACTTTSMADFFAMYALSKPKVSVCGTHGTHLELDPDKASELLKEKTRGQYQMIDVDKLGTHGPPPIGEYPGLKMTGKHLSKLLKDSSHSCIILELRGERMNHAVTITKIQPAGGGIEYWYLDSNRDPKDHTKIAPYKWDGSKIDAPGSQLISQRITDVKEFIDKQLNLHGTPRPPPKRQTYLYIDHAYVIKHTPGGPKPHSHSPEAKTMASSPESKKGAKKQYFDLMRNDEYGMYFQDEIQAVKDMIHYVEAKEILGAARKKLIKDKKSRLLRDKFYN